MVLSIHLRQMAVGCHLSEAEEGPGQDRDNMVLVEGLFPQILLQLVEHRNEAAEDLEGQGPEEEVVGEEADQIASRRIQLPCDLVLCSSPVLASSLPHRSGSIAMRTPTSLRTSTDHHQYQREHRSPIRNCNGCVWQYKITRATSSLL